MGRHAKDFTGQIFGRLTVLRRIKTTKLCTLWECLCSCGQITEVSASALVSGNTRSCGCLKLELTASRCFKHGGAYSSVYNSWTSMKGRCNRPKHHAYKDYGGRGIKVCERWENFENFLADMGERPPGASIERINNDLGYEPGNCRWATQKEQMNNTRRNILLTYKGKIQTLSQWADEYGLDRQLLWERLNKNKWPLEKALTEPKRYQQKRGYVV